MEQRFRAAVSPQLVQPDQTLGCSGIRFDAPAATARVDWRVIPPHPDGGGLLNQAGQADAGPSDKPAPKDDDDEQASKPLFVVG